MPSIKANWRKKKSQLWQSVQTISLHLLKASVLKDLHMLLLNCTLRYNWYTVLIPLLHSFTSFGVITTTFFFEIFVLKWRISRVLARLIISLLCTGLIFIVHVWPLAMEGLILSPDSSPWYLRPSIHMVFCTFLIDNETDSCLSGYCVMIPHPRLRNHGILQG